MRLFGDGYWWEFEAEAEKEGKQKVGEGVKIFIHTMVFWAKSRLSFFLFFEDIFEVLLGKEDLPGGGDFSPYNRKWLLPSPHTQ